MMSVDFWVKKEETHLKYTLSLTWSSNWATRTTDSTLGPTESQGN